MLCFIQFLVSMIEVLRPILTVILIVCAVILILLILLQSSRSAGMGLFGGGASQTAFGSSSADVLTKITGGLVTAFLLITLALAFLKIDRIDNPTPASGIDVIKAPEKGADDTNQAGNGSTEKNNTSQNESDENASTGDQQETRDIEKTEKTENKPEEKKTP